MDYKMVFIDMDGTLFDDNKQISSQNKKAIKAAIDRDVIVTLCTGRLYKFAHLYAKDLGIKAPIISANGAYIRDTKNDNIIYKCPLGFEKSKKVVDILKKYSINPHFLTSNTILTGKICYSSESYLKLNESMKEEDKFEIKVVKDWEEELYKLKEDILKCIAIDNNLEIINAAKAEMAAIQDVSVESSSFNNFEVMSNQVSKGKAVEIIVKSYNINREEIICIGDNENDLSMIKYAGLGVAMGNAIDSVKEQAYYISSSNNDNGVAQVIERFIL